jgi:hypothetical protein
VQHVSLSAKKREHFFRKKVIRPSFIEKAILGFELGLPVLQATQEGGQNTPRTNNPAVKDICNLRTL